MAQNKKQSSGRGPWIVGAVIAVVVAAAAVFAISSGGSNDAIGTEVRQFGDVTVEGVALPRFSEGDVDAAVGQTAPVITGVGFTGIPVTTRPGTPMMLVFLAHWCPNCQREVPQLVEWERSGDVPSELDVIAIATGTDPASPNFPPSQWLAREQFPTLWPVMVDNAKFDAANAFGLSAYPYFVLIDAEGKVVQRLTGETPSEQLREIIRATLGI